MSDSSGTNGKSQQWPRDSIHYIDPDGSVPPCLIVPNRCFFDKYGIRLADHSAPSSDFPRECLLGHWEHVEPVNHSEVTEEDRKPIEEKEPSRKNEVSTRLASTASTSIDSEYLL